MSEVRKIAIVTGANRGIGFEVCRQLARRGDISVILTSRDEEKGLSACEQLKEEGLNIRYLRLDVTDAESIAALAKGMKDEFGRCDILVNNAGIFPDTMSAKDEPFPSVFTASRETIQSAINTNIYGPLMLCQAIIPLMRENKYGRIVNLSSGMGQLCEMDGGYPGYRLSKTGINVLTRVFNAECAGENILVNSVCPGWVRTEMGGPNATRSVEEGADTVTWLATLSDDGPRGKFFRDRQEIAW